LDVLKKRKVKLEEINEKTNQLSDYQMETKEVNVQVIKDAIQKLPDGYRVVLRIGAEQAVLINNKKDLIEAFPDKQDKIESFISKNKIKTNKPAGIK
jgi:hypothetical protein